MANNLPSPTLLNNSGRLTGLLLELRTPVSLDALPNSSGEEVNHAMGVGRLHLKSEVMNG